MHVHRNAAAIVDHGDGIVDVNRDVDFGAIPGQSFVHRVIDYFVDEMMQARFAGRPDIHRGPQPDCFEAFQNLDRR